MKEKITIQKLAEKVREGKKISMLAVYDYPSAVLAQEAGIDSIIVGDSVSMVLYGDENTLKADMDMMIRHTRAVRKGAPNVYLIGDMPYMSYQPSIELAIKNAGRFIAEGADAVKLEGGSEIINTIKALIKSSIPVVGHIGLLPQSIAKIGGFKVQGRAANDAYKILKDAIELQEAGISMLILEGIPSQLTNEITKRLKIPVIGIGAGPHCHGQVLVLHDILGIHQSQRPKFVKQYANLADIIKNSIRKYIEEVDKSLYPDDTRTYSMPEEEYKEFIKMINELK